MNIIRIEQRLDEIETNLANVALVRKDKELTGLALHYYNDCGYLTKWMREMILTVRSLNQQVKLLKEDLHEKRKVIRLNGVYDADQLRAILDENESCDCSGSWYDDDIGY